jgi:hypothetical protein
MKNWTERTGEIGKEERGNLKLEITEKKNC